MKINFFIFFLFLNLLLCFKFKEISKLVNIYDKPDKIRKHHKYNIPLLGGIFFFINLSFYFIFVNFEFLNFIVVQKNNLEFYSFILTCMFIFFIGIYDDKHSLPASLKLLLLSFVIFVFLFLNPKDNLLIKFSFGVYIFELNLLFSFIFTILCYLLFINAFNMTDGANLLAGLYLLTIIIFIFIQKIYSDFFIILLIFIIFFLFLNYNGRIFLGDSGTILISFILSYIFIKFYNKKIILETEQIILVMLLPGLDMFRLFLERIVNKKNPFKADRNHIHHLLIDRFNHMICLFFIFLFQLIFVLQSYFYLIDLKIIFLNVVIYFILIYFLKNK